MKRIILLLFVFGASLISYAQNKNIWFPSLDPIPVTPQFEIRTSYANGVILKTNDFLRTKNNTQNPISNYEAMNVEFVSQVIGNQEWQQLYHYPTVGGGIQYAWFNQTNELGTPFSIYGIYEQHLVMKKRHTFSWGLHLGVSIGWNQYDSISNPNNVIIGTNATVYAHLRALYQYQISPHIKLNLSAGITHGSNGAMKMPNYGINIFDPRVGISYSIQTINHNRIIAPKPEVTKSNEFSIAMAFGVKQIDYYSLDPQVNKKYKNRNYTVGNLVGLYQKRISLKSKIGTGIDITIDPSGNAKGFTHGDTNAVFPAPFNEQLKLAWILSYEMMIGKFSMVLQPGFYFYRTTHDPSPFFYQRAGLRYNLDNGLFIGTAIRAVNFGQADWIEWTIGYKLKR